MYFYRAKPAAKRPGGVVFFCFFKRTLHYLFDYFGVVYVEEEEPQSKAANVVATHLSQ